MATHHILTGTRGFKTAWEQMVRFRYMVTETAKKRLKILVFWEEYGDEAAKKAFGASRATLFRWQRAFENGGRKVEVLNPRSTAPKRRRRREIPSQVQGLILAERKMEKIGKEKLAKLLDEDGIARLSASTVGRMLHDLKQRGVLRDPKRLSFSGKTGRMIQRRPMPQRKKLRSKGHRGGLVKADTIVRFQDGLRRYVSTAIDVESKFGFAHGYASHTSRAAADLMAAWKKVAPAPLTHVQTDNGSEFAFHFDLLLEKEGIVHFWSYPRSPKMNAEVERFNRTLSEAFISRRRHLLAHDLPRFNKELMDWLLWYNTRRPHWALGLVPPLRYICNNLPARESHMCWTSTRH